MNGIITPCDIGNDTFVPIEAVTTTFAELEISIPELAMPLPLQTIAFLTIAVESKDEAHVLSVFSGLIEEFLGDDIQCSMVAFDTLHRFAHKYSVVRQSLGLTSFVADLVLTIRDGPEFKKHCATCLLADLALEDANHQRIIEADAIGPIVVRLQTYEADALFAALIVLKLSPHPDSVTPFKIFGVEQVLESIVIDGPTDQLRKCALSALLSMPHGYVIPPEMMKSLLNTDDDTLLLCAITGAPEGFEFQNAKPLVDRVLTLLRNTDSDSLQTTAVSAIYTMMLFKHNFTNRLLAIEAGVYDVIFPVLLRGPPFALVCCISAVLAILATSSNESGYNMTADMCGMDPAQLIVNALSGQGDTMKADMLLVLSSITSEPTVTPFQSRFISNGGMTQLVPLLGHTNATISARALTSLTNIVTGTDNSTTTTNHAKVRAAVREARVIDVLTTLLHYGEPHQQNAAAELLRRLALEPQHPSTVSDI